MVDPLVSISLASNALQSISFIGNLLNVESQVRKNAGLSIKNAEIKTIAQTIKNLCQGLRVKPTTDSNMSGTESDLKALCTQCSDVADMLLRALKTLEHDGTTIGRSWRSFRVAILSVLNEQKVDDILKRLEQYRRAIDTTLLALIV
jgi:hypothetical protein